MRIPWPFEREPIFPESQARNLVLAWRDSAARIRNIRDALSGELPDSVACVAVSGSLARMESHRKSDVDLIIVVDDRQSPLSPTDTDAVWARVWNQLDAVNAVQPKPGGIFSECARWTDLVDPAARGRIDESIITFGHRIQLLLDAQAVCHSDSFNALRRDILRWYAEYRLTAVFDEPGPLHWLLQDVLRYWRSLRSRSCWLHADEPEKSLLLNVKLRSSRLTLIYAFIMAINDAHREAHVHMTNRLLDSLYQTPLERLFGGDSDNARSGLVACDIIWTFLRDHASADTSELPKDVADSLRALSKCVVTAISLRAEDDLHSAML